MTREQILILKHGALGDIVLATAGFAAIRDAFPDAHITVLTGRLMPSSSPASPYFDEIWVDPKRPPFDLKGVRDIVRTLNSKRWSWVFDLQMSLRSATYQWLFVPPWAAHQQRQPLVEPRLCRPQPPPAPRAATAAAAAAGRRHRRRRAGYLMAERGYKRAPA
ncbi:MAG: hypothetical protein WDN72_05995 [Alphaproteobacteria bacterium]